MKQEKTTKAFKTTSNVRNEFFMLNLFSFFIVTIFLFSFFFFFLKLEESSKKQEEKHGAYIIEIVIYMFYLFRI